MFERALAKDPAARFADLRSFLLALVDAAALAEARRATLRALIGTSDTVDLDRTHVSAERTVTATTATSGVSRQKPVLREGVSGRSLGRLLGGAGGGRDRRRGRAVAGTTGGSTEARTCARAGDGGTATCRGRVARGAGRTGSVADGSRGRRRTRTAVPVAAASADRDAGRGRCSADRRAGRRRDRADRFTAGPWLRRRPSRRRRGVRQPTAVAKKAKRDGAATAASARAAAPPPASPPAQAAPVWGEIRSEGAQRTD